MKKCSKFSKEISAKIQDIFGKKTVPLHEPNFDEADIKSVTDSVKSTFVSSVGPEIGVFEQQISNFIGASGAVAVTNGTAGLYVALYCIGVRNSDLVITQALNFVAVMNASNQLGAECIFVDVSKSHMSMCPIALEDWLNRHAHLDCDGQCFEKTSGRRIKAIIPMDTFGHVSDIEKINSISKSWNIDVVSDSAESLGSFSDDIHSGVRTRFGVLSFNGNKIITTGAGGMVICRHKEDEEKIRHLTTTSKLSHSYKFFHDQFGFNLRMPNLNASLGVAQFRKLKTILKRKRVLAHYYENLFSSAPVTFFREPAGAKSNYWLNTIICPNEAFAEEFLSISNSLGVNARACWSLLSSLPMANNVDQSLLPNSNYLAKRIVNLPSSANHILNQ